MSITILYLLLVVLPSASSWLSFLTFLAGAGAVISLIITVANAPACGSDDEKKIASMQSLAKKFLIALLILGTFDIFLPDAQQVYSLAGAYAVTNDKELAKLPDNVLRAANSYLEKYNEEKAKRP